MIVAMSEMHSTDPAAAVPEWTLGWRLRRALDYADKSREDIAEELGVSPSTISRWLHDDFKRPLNKLFLHRWANFTEVSMEWLTGNANGPTGGPGVAPPSGLEPETYRFGGRRASLAGKRSLQRLPQSQPLAA